MPYWIFLILVTAIASPISPLSAVALLPVAAMQIRRRWPHSLLSWLILGWLIWLPMTLFWSISPGFSIQFMSTLLCLPLGWMAGRTLTTRDGISGFDRLLLHVLGLFLFWFVMWGVLQGPDTQTAKPQGPFNDPNTFSAGISLLFLPVLAGYLNTDPKTISPKHRCLTLALLGAALFVQFLIASRGAFLALVLTAPMVLFLARGRPYYIRKLALLAVVGTVAFLFTQSLNPNSIGQRISETVVEGDSTRWMLMRSAFKMALEHPWLGSGLGSFRLRYPLFRDHEETVSGGGWVHNDYLQAWVEAGIPFLFLLLGIVIWVARAILLTFKRRDEGALIQMGYLSAVAAVLLHATVNFLLFFAFISLLLGLYLARVDPSTVGMNTLEEVRKPSRAYGMAVAGYSLIVGYLLFGQIMVQAFLENATRVQRVLLERGALYPRYEIAYWLSIFSPFHPSPPQIMGIELANAYLLTGGGNPAIGLAALDYMDEAWRLAPCYLPFAQDSMTFVQQNRKDVILRKRGQEIAERALKCDVRYGLGYYYSGLFADSPDIAVERWRVGLENCPKQSDQWLLTAAILSVTSTTYPSKYSDLASQIAQRSLNYMDGTPNRNVDLEFWRQVEITLSHLK